jgi:cytochrome c oxidase subunit II
MLHRKRSVRQKFGLKGLRLGIYVPLLLLLSGCGVRALDPAGPAAASIAGLWWVMFGVSAVIFVIVVALLVVALRRPRKADDESSQRGRQIVTWGGAIIPGLVVLGLMVYNTYITVDLEEPPTPPATTIEIHSHQWWWHIYYPDYDIEIANEIHIPVGQSIILQMHSDDVIHALWVPQLHGKRDLMPDHAGNLWLQADRAGTYRGLCAEFCGLQHAKMQFLVIAHEPDEFAAWVEERQAAALKNTGARPESDRAFRGQQVFLGSECVYCHTVRGTNATGTMGPDLTHLASRRELGAGTLPNTRGYLAGWIIDAQQFKKGNLMPPMPMAGQDLLDMLVYLETLD